MSEQKMVKVGTEVPANIHADFRVKCLRLGVPVRKRLLEIIVQDVVDGIE